MFRCFSTLSVVQKCIKNNEIRQPSLKSAILFVQGTTNTCAHSTRTASFKHVGQKSILSPKLKTNHQVVYLSYRSPKPFKQSNGRGSNPCDKDYNDGVDREFHLVYALDKIDKGYMFIAGLAVGIPLLFLSQIGHFFYKEYKELEYLSNNLSEVFNNCVEIYNHLPVSFEWVYVIFHITLFGGLMYFLLVKNTIGRLYYSAKQDRYIAVVYKYGFKSKIEFSRKDITRKPVFYEEFMNKLGVDIGKKKRYFVYESGFRGVNDRNRFFSEIASDDYLDELNK